MMERAHSMVSVDTGPSHMAAAVGCPQVVLYGAEPAEVWSRRGSLAQPIIELSGPPENRSASTIPADRVIAAWRDLADRIERASEQRCGDHDVSVACARLP
jgi:heptosyltransferase-2/heptosyltransferase-3